MRAIAVSSAEAPVASTSTSGGASSSVVSRYHEPRGRIATRRDRRARMTRGRATMASFAIMFVLTGGWIGASACVTPGGVGGRSVSARTEPTSYATRAELKGDSGAEYDAQAVDASFARCFDTFLFESDDASSVSGFRWMLTSWPAASALSNSTSYANATFVADGSVSAILRPDVEGNYTAVVVDANDCVASESVRVEAVWTCEPGSNTSIALAFIGFGAFCVYWFGRSLPSSDFNDERNVLLDVGASYDMIGRGEEKAEREEEFEQELQETMTFIKTEYLTYITKLDLEADVKNATVERRRIAREKTAKQKGLWTPEEEAFQKRLYEQELADRSRAALKDNAMSAIARRYAAVKYHVSLRITVFKMKLDHAVSQMLSKDYWCQQLLRFQLCVEFFAFTAFAWRRTAHSNEMYRDGFAGVVFWSNLFGPDLAPPAAASTLSNMFVLMLFAAVVLPLLAKFCEKVAKHLYDTMWLYAELVELGGDLSLEYYTGLGDDGGDGDDEDEDIDAILEGGSGILDKVRNRFHSIARTILCQPRPRADDFEPVRDGEKQRMRIVRDVEWEKASDARVMRTVRVETASPANARYIPRKAAHRMEEMAKSALLCRRRSQTAASLQARLSSVAIVLRVIMLRVTFVPMICSSLGFLMVTTSFTPTPWVHLSKKRDAAFGANMINALFVGLGGTFFAMKTALDTECVSANLRPLPSFELANVFLKLLMATFAAYMEAELPAAGFPAASADARIRSLNTGRDFLLILVCVVLLVLHVQKQSLRGFGKRWNETRAGSFAGATLFAIVTFAARTFNDPPWQAHGIETQSSWSRPGTIIGIVITIIAMIVARVLNHQRDFICINDEVRKLRDPEQAEKADEVLSPEFVEEQVESDHRRDRVVALLAFYDLLDVEQRTKLVSSLLKKTKMKKKSETPEEDWENATDAFDELSAMVHCCTEDFEASFLAKSGEELYREIMDPFVKAVVEITLWCNDESDSIAWGGVQRIVGVITKCIKDAESKTLLSVVASVTMECVQSVEFANVMATLLFNAHDIDLDQTDGEFDMSFKTLRLIIDDAFAISSPKLATKVSQPVTHIRNPDTDELRALDRSERVLYVAQSWLRVEQDDDDETSEYTAFTKMGYHATVTKLREEADEERTEMANDFMSTLFKATLSIDQQISFYAICTVATLVRVGGATASVFEIDGLQGIFECMVRHSGTSNAAFVADIMHALIHDVTTRSDLLKALAGMITSLSESDGTIKLHASELMHQVIKLELSAVQRAMVVRDDRGQHTPYVANMSPPAAQLAHDALYSMLVDAMPEIREIAVGALADLVTLYTRGAQGMYYIFQPLETTPYVDAAFRKFVDERERRLPGGALMASRLSRKLRRAEVSASDKRDADKLIAVYLKVIDTDDNDRVRSAAENALDDMKRLLGDELGASSVMLYDTKVQDAGGLSAPSRETMRDVTSQLHDAVQKQRDADETGAKIRLNEFWREKKFESSESRPRSTRGGKVERIVNEDAPAESINKTLGGKVPLAKTATGYRRTESSDVTFIRHPPPDAPKPAIERHRLARSARRADRLAKRDACTERWYGSDEFKRRPRGSSAGETQREVKIDTLNERPTFTAPSYGVMRLPRDFRKPPNVDN